MEPARHPPRKRIRLDRSIYAQDSTICSITIAVQHRRPVFAESAVAAAVVEVLRAHATRTGVAVHAYCVMPDHIHLLIGPSDQCDLITFVAQFKNLALRAAWQLGVQGSFWQKRFFDHFLREDGDLMRAVEYILANPVRGGLVQYWWDYPYVGSFVHDLRGIAQGDVPRPPGDDRDGIAHDGITHDNASHS